MRILHILTYPPDQIGGQEIFVKNLTWNLKKQNVYSEIITADKKRPQPFVMVYNGIKVHFARYYFSLWNINPVFNIFPILFKIAHNFDIIHIHSYVYFSSIQAMLFAKLKKKPVLLTLHGSGQKGLWKDINISEKIKLFIKNIIFDKTLGSFVIKQADILHSVSRKDILELNTNFSLYRKRNYWIPNAVDNKLFHYVENQKRKYITFIGRFSLIKGFDIFLQIAKQLLNRNNQVDFLIIGNGELAPLFDEFKENPHFRHINQVNHDEMQKIYADTRIYLLSSRFEGLPTTIIESMACGVPVVASNVGGNKDLIQHGKSGYLFNFQEPNQSLEYLESLLQSNKIWHEMSKNSIQIISNFFTWQVNSMKMKLLYKKLLSIN